MEQELFRVRFFKKIPDWIFKSERIRKWSWYVKRNRRIYSRRQENWIPQFNQYNFRISRFSMFSMPYNWKNFLVTFCLCFKQVLVQSYFVKKMSLIIILRKDLFLLWGNRQLKNGLQYLHYIFLFVPTVDRGELWTAMVQWGRYFKNWPWSCKWIVLSSNVWNSFCCVITKVKLNWKK